MLMTLQRLITRASHDDLGWLIALRWIVGSAAVVGGLLNWLVLRWYEPAGLMLLVGATILLYNAVFWLGMMRWPRHRRGRVLAAGSQIVLDLGCLTVVVGHTGGIQSPFLGFFVFHMVFSSLVLPPLLAYCSAAVAVLLVAASLDLADQTLLVRDHMAILFGWLATLLLTVWLTNGMTQSLLRHRRRLASQKRRVQAMSHQLRRHQQAMIQHEKMVTVGQMASGIAHEIANPLASIDSLLQLAERRPERLNTQTLQMLRQQTDRIHRTIRQMREFAYPAQCQSHLISLEEVVEQSLGMLALDPRLDRVEIQRHFDPGVGSVDCSPQALQQVIVNLVVNALDAMEQTPHPRLTLSTRQEEGCCLLEVRDNGTGIDPKTMGTLFEPFYTTKALGKGTGLGLSISNTLVRRHGGTIEVASQMGQGTAFTVRLPAANDQPNPADSQVSRL